MKRDDTVYLLHILDAIDLFEESVDHERIKRSPKTGVRAYARTPVFGEPLSFREVLRIYKGNV